jgi:hypothetical protein
VAVEAVVHKEGCLSLVFVVVVGVAIHLSSSGLSAACCGVVLVFSWARGLEFCF